MEEKKSDEEMSSGSEENALDISIISNVESVPGSDFEHKITRNIETIISICNDNAFSLGEIGMNNEQFKANIELLGQLFKREIKVKDASPFIKKVLVIANKYKNVDILNKEDISNSIKDMQKLKPSDIEIDEQVEEIIKSDDSGKIKRKRKSKRRRKSKSRRKRRSKSRRKRKSKH